MNLTTRQVADKLGVTTSAVLQMSKRGLLKNVVPNGDGKKHHAAFDSREANAFKKTYHKRASTSNIEEPETRVAPLGRITRLQRIEGKIEKLIKMWQ